MPTDSVLTQAHLLPMRFYFRSFSSQPTSFPMEPEGSSETLQWSSHSPASCHLLRLGGTIWSSRLLFSLAWRTPLSQAQGTTDNSALACSQRLLWLGLSSYLPLKTVFCDLGKCDLPGDRETIFIYMFIPQLLTGCLLNCRQGQQHKPEPQ